MSLLTLLGLAATVLPASAQAEEAAAAPAGRYPDSGQVIVRQGDTLYAIARRTLGDGSRYVEIFAINEGLPQADGGTLTDPGVLHVGWRLELPVEDPPAGGGGGGGGTTPPPTGGRRYTVVAGDSLSSIAQAQLGSAARYNEIFEKNEGVPQAVGGSLTNPSVLRVGWVLRLPPRNGGGGGTTPDGPDTYREHTVVAGDSLSSIAADELGSAARYQEIFDLNVGRAQAVGGSLSNASQLRVGWVLRLPVE